MSIMAKVSQRLSNCYQQILEQRRLPRAHGKSDASAGSTAFHGLLSLEEREILSVSGQLESLADADILPPTVTQVMVKGSSWTPAFVEYLRNNGYGERGYTIPVGPAAHNKSVPFSNVNQIIMQFSEDIVGFGDALTVRGLQHPNMEISSIQYEPSTFTVTWTLSTFMADDKYIFHLADSVMDTAGNSLDGDWIDGSPLQTSGDGVAGHDFKFPVNVLPGNVDDTTVVLGNDVILIRNAQFTDIASPAYKPHFDINGSGGVLGDDVILVRNRQFSTLPDGENDLNNPTLSLSLIQDTGFSSTDGVTHDPTVRIEVQDLSPIIQLMVSVNAPFIYSDMTALMADGILTLDSSSMEAVAGAPLTDGTYTIRAFARDAVGNHSDPIELSFTLDFTHPRLMVLSATEEMDSLTNSISMVWSEPMSDEALNAQNYSLIALAGGSLGNVIYPTALQTHPEGIVELIFDQSLSSGSYHLALGTPVEDAAGNMSQPSLLPLVTVKYSRQATRPLVASYGWELPLQNKDMPLFIEQDDNGDIYLVTILTAASDVDPGEGIVMAGPTDQSQRAILVAKYSPTGHLFWADTLLEWYTQELRDVHVDEFGHIYLVGAFNGDPNFAMSRDSQPFHIEHIGLLDGFVAKIGNDGHLNWARAFGTVGNDYVTAVDTSSIGTYRVTVVTDGVQPRDYDENLIPSEFGLYFQYGRHDPNAAADRESLRLEEFIDFTSYEYFISENGEADANPFEAVLSFSSYHGYETYYSNQWEQAGRRLATNDDMIVFSKGDQIVISHPDLPGAPRVFRTPQPGVAIRDVAVGDGFIAAVTEQGALFIYTADSNGIVANVPVAPTGFYFGHFNSFGCALAADGPRLAVVRYNDLGTQVAVYRVGADPVTLEEEYVISAAAQLGDTGFTIDLDGDLLAIGQFIPPEITYQGNLSLGYVDIYQYLNDDWGTVARITSPAGEDILFGGAVSINESTLAISNRKGSVYLYRSNGLGGWFFDDLVSQPLEYNYGSSLYVTDTYLVVGSPSRGNGVVYSYTRVAPGEWLPESVLHSYDYEIVQGESMDLGQSVASFGDHILVAAPRAYNPFYDNYEAGAVLLLKPSSSTPIYPIAAPWPIVSDLTRPRATLTDRAGSLVVRGFSVDTGQAWIRSIANVIEGSYSVITTDFGSVVATTIATATSSAREAVVVGYDNAGQVDWSHTLRSASEADVVFDQVAHRDGDVILIGTGMGNLTVDGGVIISAAGDNERRTIMVVFDSLTGELLRSIKVAAGGGPEKGDIVSLGGVVTAFSRGALDDSYDGVTGLNTADTQSVHVVVFHDSDRAAQLALLGTATIADEHSLPHGADGRDFGTVLTSHGTVTRHFWIENRGSGTYRFREDFAPIVVGENASEFVLLFDRPLSLAPGERTELSIAFSPASAGLRTATLVIPGLAVPSELQLAGLAVETVTAILPSYAHVRESDAPGVTELSQDVRVILEEPLDHDLEYVVTVVSGSATVGQDYTVPLANMKQVLPAGERLIPVNVLVIDDAVPEGTETFDISLSTFGVGPQLEFFRGSVPILPSDGPQSIVAHATSGAEGESRATVTFSRTGPNQNANTLFATVRLDTSISRAATAADDFTVQMVTTYSSGNVTVSGVDLEADIYFSFDSNIRYVTLEVIPQDDGEYEGVEYVLFELIDLSSWPTYSIAQSQSYWQVALNDNDDPTVWIVSSGNRISESAGADNSVVIQIHRSGALDAILPIGITFAPPLAGVSVSLDGISFEGPITSIPHLTARVGLVFSAGQRTISIIVRGVNDLSPEYVERFAVRLEKPIIEVPAFGWHSQDAWRPEYPYMIDKPRSSIAIELVDNDWILPKTYLQFSPDSSLGTTVDSDADGIEDAYEQIILDRFAPMLVPEEPLARPFMSFEWFVNHARVEEMVRVNAGFGFYNTWVAAPGLTRPSVDELATYLGHGRLRTNDSVEISPENVRLIVDDDRFLSGEDPNDRWTEARALTSGDAAYGRVSRVVHGNPNLLVLQYYFYLPWNETSVVGGYGNHLSDVLCIDLTIDVSARESPEIQQAVYHNHGRQFFYQPDQLLYEGTHPKAYLEKGTNELHAHPSPFRGLNEFSGSLLGGGWTNETFGVIVEDYVIRSHRGAPEDGLGGTGTSFRTWMNGGVMNLGETYSPMGNEALVFLGFPGPLGDGGSPSGPFFNSGGKMWSRWGWKGDRTTPPLAAFSESEVVLQAISAPTRVQAASEASIEVQHSFATVAALFSLSATSSDGRAATARFAVPPALGAEALPAIAGLSTAESRNWSPASQGGSRIWRRLLYRWIDTKGDALMPLRDVEH